MSDLSRTFYGRCAQLYDLVATAPGVRSWRKRAVDALSLTGGETVVEMGCGTGANFPYLSEQVGPTGQVVGVDVVGAMLGQARKRIDRAGWENVDVLQGDATRPPVESVDAVLSTFLVGMLAAPGAAVERWADLLDSGGRIVLLNAGRSNLSVAAPINLLIRLFVRATAPGSRTRLRAPVRDLEARWLSARDRLFEITPDHHETRFGAGVFRLAAGRVEQSR